MNIQFKTLILTLFTFFTILNLSYAITYPNADFDSLDDVESVEDISFTGQACVGCEVRLYINNQLKGEIKIHVNSNIVDWNNVGSVIEFTPQEKFKINYTDNTPGATATSYTIDVFNLGSETVAINTLSSEYTFSSNAFDSQSITLQSDSFVAGGISKSAIVIEELKEFEFQNLTLDDFISGQNIIRYVVSGNGFNGAGDDIEETFSIEVEKYPIKFELDEDNTFIVNTKGGFIFGEMNGVEDYSNIEFGYLTNSPGEVIVNTGLIRDFEVNITNGKFNFSIPISSLREGYNTFDLIAYERGNKANFLGFRRLNITRDTLPPEVKLERVIIYDGSQVKYNYSSHQLDDVIFSGYDKVEVVVRTDAESIFTSYANSDFSNEILVFNETARFSLRLQEGDSLVKDIADDIEDLKSENEIIEEYNVSLDLIQQINSAMQKLQEEGDVRDSRWHKEVAQELQVGHFLRVKAVDIGDNQVIESIKVLFDDEEPQLIAEDMEPKSIFEDGEVFSNIGYVKGKTNQPYVEVSFLVITDEDYVQTNEGNRQQLTCDNVYEYYESGVFWKNNNFNDENLDDDRDASFDAGFTIRFTDILGIFGNNRIEFKSDKSGDFGSENIVDAIVSDEGLGFRTMITEDNRAGSHKNTICVFMRNQYGKTNQDKIDVTYFTGNFDWDMQPPTYNRNIINPYEIESSQDGNYRTAITLELEYVGQLSQANSLDFSNVRVSRRGSEPKDVAVVNNEVVYFYQDGTLNVYVPLEFRKRGITIDEYPNKETLTLEVRPTANVEGYDIDNTNPEFIDIEIKYDNNLATNWLSPKMIDSGIKFLNKTKDLTGSLRDGVRTIVPYGALTCVGARFWFAISTMGLDENNPDDKEQLDKKKETLAYVCDRTFCSASPHACEQNEDITQSPTFIGYNQSSGFELNDGDSFSTLEEGSDRRILSELTNVNLGSSCLTTDGTQGVIVSADFSNYEEHTNNFYTASDSVSTGVVRNKCIKVELAQNYKAEFETCQSMTGADKTRCETDARNNNLLGVDLNLAQGACYSEEAPRFDHTRCLGKKGYDPSDNLIESMSCGCIPETYQHLNKIYKTQEAIIQCLEDVKTGEVEGTYCERLVSVTVCDMATSLIFNSVENARAQQREDEEVSPILGVFNALDKTDQLVEDRYSDVSLYSSASGFNTKHITNSLCLFSFSGDFTAFETALIGDLETAIETDPQHFYTTPQVSFDSFNPLLGDLSVSYKFTHNGISGGSAVRFNYEFVCDSTLQGGEYCPEGVTKGQDIDASVYSPKTLTIPAGGSEQKLVQIRDNSANFIFNKLVTTVQYDKGGETVTRTFEEQITRTAGSVLGSGAFGSCGFDSSIDLGVLSGGIRCTSQFSGMSSISYYRINDNTHVMPKENSQTVLYPGSAVGINLHYQARGTDFSSQDRGTLWYRDSCTGVIDGRTLNGNHIEGQNGNFYMELFTIPSDSSDSRNNGFVTSSTMEFRAGVQFNDIVLNGVSDSTPAELKVSKITIDGSEVSLGSGIVLQIDKSSKTLTNKARVIQQINGALNGEISSGDTRTIGLTLDENPQGLSITLKSANGDLQFSGFNQVNSFQARTCQLDLRIVGSDVTLTSETFDLDILEDQGIQTDSQTAGMINEIYKTEYVTQKRGDSKLVAEFITHSEDSIVCVNNQGIPPSNSIAFKPEYSATSGYSVDTLKDRLEIQLELTRFDQEPIKMSTNKISGQNALVATSSSGSFSISEGFENAQFARLSIYDKTTSKTIESINIKMRTCE